MGPRKDEDDDLIAASPDVATRVAEATERFRADALRDMSVPGAVEETINPGFIVWLKECANAIHPGRHEVRKVRHDDGVTPDATVHAKAFGHVGYHRSIAAELEVGILTDSAKRNVAMDQFRRYDARKARAALLVSVEPSRRDILVSFHPDDDLEPFDAARFVERFEALLTLFASDIYTDGDEVIRAVCVEVESLAKRWGALEVAHAFLEHKGDLSLHAVNRARKVAHLARNVPCDGPSRGGVPHPVWGSRLAAAFGIRGERRASVAADFESRGVEDDRPVALVNVEATCPSAVPTTGHVTVHTDNRLWFAVLHIYRSLANASIPDLRPASDPVGAGVERVDLDDLQSAKQPVPAKPTRTARQPTGAWAAIIAAASPPMGQQLHRNTIGALRSPDAVRALRDALAPFPRGCVKKLPKCIAFDVPDSNGVNFRMSVGSLGHDVHHAARALAANEADFDGVPRPCLIHPFDVRHVARGQVDSGLGPHAVADPEILDAVVLLAGKNGVPVVPVMPFVGVSVGSYFLGPGMDGAKYALLRPDSMGLADLGFMEPEPPAWLALFARAVGLDLDDYTVERPWETRAVRALVALSAVYPEVFEAGDLPDVGDRIGRAVLHGANLIAAVNRRVPNLPGLDHPSRPSPATELLLGPPVRTGRCPEDIGLVKRVRGAFTTEGYAMNGAEVFPLTDPDYANYLLYALNASFYSRLPLRDFLEARRFDPARVARTIGRPLTDAERERLVAHSRLTPQEEINLRFCADGVLRYHSHLSEARRDLRGVDTDPPESWPGVPVSDEADVGS